MRCIQNCIVALGCLLICGASAVGLADELTPEQVAFFEARVRPLLVKHCYACHSADAEHLQGGLKLDSREGWRTGGDSGDPAVVPGQPEGSPLIRAVRHDPSVEAMPPNQPRLSEAAIADLATWVNMGAPDPRQDQEPLDNAQNRWDEIFAERLAWWSLQAVTPTKPPRVKGQPWVRNPVDNFILAGLEANGLQPSPAADRLTLARRLSFALTGLPPGPELLDDFVGDASPLAYDRLVQSLLGSPHFGEHWARHWMDVVHYADTHGYEWDVPAKNAWRYRDYVVRAFNCDLPINAFMLEQIAGDLIAPRVDAQSGLNQSLIGSMALRLGERRHGDNAAVEGVTQEAIANVVDTLGRGFMGVTVACAQCHDHKLDAVEQQDFYAFAGMYMSSRWGARSADGVDPNGAVLEQLQRIKRDIRRELARFWLDSRDSLAARIKALPGDASASPFPETIQGFWQRSQTTPITPDAFAAERQRRVQENRANLRLLADFTGGDSAGWRWDGFGMQHGLVHAGEIVVSDEGNQLLVHVLPAGRWSHVWSMRLAGALRSPLLDATAAKTLSVGYAGGRHAAQSFIVDHAFHCERMQFLDRPAPSWLTLTAGNFDTLEGSVDRAPRRVYLELVTKGLNNYFPPRTGYGGLKESDLEDQRSWFGVTRIYEHPAGKPPLDELGRFAPLFEPQPVAEESDWAERIATLVLAAVERWSNDACDSESVQLLNDALQLQLLTNDINASPELAGLAEAYRATEKQLQLDQTVGAAEDWSEGRDQPLGIRGSYTDLGRSAPRGNLRLLGGPADRTDPRASGRLEFARSLVSDHNPLTARVFVNRVWLHLFGAGLVRTPDDFGHLGELPSHPELLDYLAARFMAEGWSLKRLVNLLVTSATWRQSSVPAEAAAAIDPENRLWSHMALRRLEAEAIRDSILAASGNWDPQLSGPPIDPYRTATDAAKRLFCGPLDGRGRRSLYIKMTLMEPPRFLALFNQPIPKLTTGRRDVTSVPDQALALLNDPFVHAMAGHWGAKVIDERARSPEERVRSMYLTALGRPPTTQETARLVRLAQSLATLHGADPSQLLQCQAAWRDVAHVLFNLKEFIYVP